MRLPQAEGDVVRNRGATRPSDFASRVFWGMVGAILGGILGRGLSGAFVGIAVLGGGLYLVKRAFPCRRPAAGRLPQAQVGARRGIRGIVIAIVTRGPVIPFIAMGAAAGVLIRRYRLRQRR